MLVLGHVLIAVALAVALINPFTADPVKDLNFAILV